MTASRLVVAKLLTVSRMSKVDYRNKVTNFLFVIFGMKFKVELEFCDSKPNLNLEKRV